MLAIDLLTRVGLATALGVLIGVERQWRSRMAGLQTMALVSMGSALFFILGAFAFPGGDPTRVAAQIVSGIGFLGAGVIMKHGLTVTGLNTAATLWSTAAVGALAGAWMWREAIAGAVIIVTGNLTLHFLAGAMDRRKSWVGREAAPAPLRRSIRVECATDIEPELRRQLLESIDRGGLQLAGIRTDSRGLGAAEVCADVDGGDDDAARAIVAEYAGDPRVIAVRWTQGNTESVA